MGAQEQAREEATARCGTASRAVTASESVNANAVAVVLRVATKAETPVVISVDGKSFLITRPWEKFFSPLCSSYCYYRDGGGNNPGNNLHVSGLAHKIDNRELEEAFAKFGKVTRPPVCCNPHKQNNNTPPRPGGPCSNHVRPAHP